MEGFVEVNEVVILVVEVGLGEVVGVDDVIVEVVVVVVSFFKWGYVIWKVFVLILLFDVERKKKFLFDKEDWVVVIILRFNWFF